MNLSLKNSAGKSAGIKITKDKLFDMSVIKEVYEENPELKATPGVREVRFIRLG